MAAAGKQADDATVAVMGKAGDVSGSCLLAGAGRCGPVRADVSNAVDLVLVPLEMRNLKVAGKGF